MKFYDAHIHNPGEEAGGFLVGLEGEPWFEENSPAFRVPGRILHNTEAAAIAAAHPDRYCFFRYVTREEVLSDECLVLSAECLVPSAECLVPSAECLVPSAECLVPSTAQSTKHQAQSTSQSTKHKALLNAQGTKHKAQSTFPSTKHKAQSTSPSTKHQAPSTKHTSLLKFHPRRERYAPDEVIEAIRWMRPKAVMIDTLNEPDWVAYDYWKVCRAFPEIIFLLPHSGGYLINDFIKICHFQKNVYIDFTLTHTNFGGVSANPLPYVDQAITYALNAPFRERVLMGSDLPFFNQLDVVKYYEKLGKLEMLNDNFERLFERLVLGA